jgi:hypothetical protein
MCVLRREWRKYLAMKDRGKGRGYMKGGGNMRSCRVGKAIWGVAELVRQYGVLQSCLGNMGTCRVGKAI